MTSGRVGAAVAALAMVGAAPAAEIVPNSGGGPALVIPADSPVKFTGFSADGVASFSGRFVLTGTFVYDCPADCEPPMTEDDVELHVLPDPEVAARLPHWQDRGETIMVDVRDYARFKRLLASNAQVADLLAGKVPDVRGRISVVVDRYAAHFVCDYSPYYSARLIAFAEPPTPAHGAVEVPSGCI